MKFFVYTLFIGLLAAEAAQAQPVSGFNTGTVTFQPSDSRAVIEASGAAFVESGNRRIFIGTHQASAINQNPVIASFTGTTRDWAVADYETGGNDGRGMGLLWDQAGRLYAAFTITGNDMFNISLSRFATDGWLSSYGSGGGARATFLLRLDPATGQAIEGTFIRAQLSTGNTNTLVPVGLDFVGNHVVLRAESFFSPLRTDQQRMVQDGSGASPFDYQVLFDASLGNALIAEAIGWDGVTAFSNLELVLKDGFEAP